MKINELIRELRNRGLQNGSTLGHHSGFYDEVADAMEIQRKRIVELEEQQRWIPVTERLPEHSGEYLVFRIGHQLLLNYSERHRRFNCFDWYSDNEAEEMHIDGEYWRDLPEPPKEVRIERQPAHNKKEHVKNRKEDNV